MRRFLKELTLLASEKPSSLKVPLLISHKEVDDLNDMKRKANMFDKWFDVLKKELNEILTKGYTNYEESLTLWKKIEEYLKKM